MPQGVPQGMEHMGRAEPANRIIPFFLNPEEQRELDEFLVRWERYSATIQRYDVNFNLLMFDMTTIPGAQSNQPHRRAFGYFKYNSNPRRFLYAVEGEWHGDRQIRRDDRNPHIFAEKVIIDERSVHQYDYNSQKVRQINIPPEMIGGIADSPLPLIFGAKADDLKRRFSMRIVPVPGRDDIIWLHARPLLIEDQQEFKELEILIDRRTLTAQGLRQWDINGKAYRVFELRQPQINGPVRSLLEDIRKWFTADVPRGWTREIVEWDVPSPHPAPSMQQPRIANPH
jgi:TIGR03009 family protein